MIARWMIAGFVLWLLITVAFRYIGADVLNLSGVAWLFMVMPVIMFVLTWGLLTVFKVDATDRAEAAGIFAVPGLVGGIYEINSFRFVFPDVDPSLGPAFAAMMFASYAAVIIAGIVSSRLNSASGG
jgi:hypothetical protein